MELLKNWTMTMAAILVLGSLCEVLLPDGSFQKYIRLSVGMVLVISLVSPLRGCNGDLPEFKDISLDSFQVRQQTEQIQQEDVAVLYRENLEKTILNYLRSGYSEAITSVQCQVEEADQKTFGTIRKVTIEINQSETAFGEETIKQLLKHNFGIDESRISIKFLKEKS